MVTVKSFREVYEERHLLAREWKRQGKRVFGYLYSHVPEELIYAANIIPVQLTESEERSSYISGSQYFEAFYCDFVASCLGQALEGVYSYLDGIVLPQACETAIALAGIWKVTLKTPFFHWLNICAEATDGSRAFFTEEINRFKQAIENFTGEQIRPERLRAAIETYNENRALLKRLYELRLQERPPISGRQVFDVVRAGLVMPKEEHNAMLQELLAQLSGETSEQPSRTRLMVSCLIYEECIPATADIISMVEEFGGDVVADDLCTGIRYFGEPVVIKDNPMEAIVERYLATIPNPFKFLAARRTEQLLEQARRYNVKGAIFIIPKYCTSYMYEMPNMRQRFAENGYPVLLLETTHSMPAAPLRTRVQAFLETLA